MDKNVISCFEIEVNHGYCEVTLVGQANGREIKHCYRNVPTKLVKKLINASKEPSIKDFDSWYSDYIKERDKEREASCVTPFGNESFWS